MDKYFYVYILASRRNGTLYIGVTSHLLNRVQQHRSEATDSFTKRYQIKQLVYYEQHSCAYNAIQREKQVKRWKRQWKLNLIEGFNPNWTDLYDEIVCY